MHLLDQVRDVGFARSGFLQATTTTGVMFANPGPFKVVSELVRFQRLCDFLSREEAGKLCLLQ